MDDAGVGVGLNQFRGRRVLLLQGPVGPFFRRLARDLRAAGAAVEKVNFNGGDWLFYPRGARSYRGRLDGFADYLRKLVRERRIDTMLLYGDCRPVHRIARSVAAELGLPVGVFEEGYVRPDYVTLEWGGVNGYSTLPKDPEFYLRQEFDAPGPPQRVGNTFYAAALWAVLYYLAAAVARPWFPHYQHHRPLVLAEAWPWLRGAWRKVIYGVRERGLLARFAGELSGRYFLVPLQLYVDAQIRVHSPFDSVAEFISGVIASFAGHAPPDTHLIVKHHPFDRGYNDYGSLIAEEARRQGIGDRVHYVHDLHLPTLLRHARGVVLVNSTVGMSALFHGAPLKVCGSANYDMPGLVYQGTLDDFWHEAEGSRPDPNLHRRFRAFLIRATQINGSFYRRMKQGEGASGLRWAEMSPPPWFRTGHVQELERKGA